MPSFLNLVTGGNLLLVSGGNLLLASGASYEEWQIYDFDTVEAAVKSVIVSAVDSPSAPVQVTRSRETVSSETPYVILLLDTQVNQTQRYILNPAIETVLQPFNTWFYSLTAEIVTNRIQPNASMHAELVAKVRMALQYYKLANSAFSSLSPLHSFTDLVEQPIVRFVNDDGSLDSTKLTFTGMLCIRNTAWIR